MELACDSRSASELYLLKRAHSYDQTTDVAQALSLLNYLSSASFPPRQSILQLSVDLDDHLLGSRKCRCRALTDAGVIELELCVAGTWTCDLAATRTVLDLLPLDLDFRLPLLLVRL